MPERSTAIPWSFSTNAALAYGKLRSGSGRSDELSLVAFGRRRSKAAGEVQLLSRNDKDFNVRYPAIVKSLAMMPDDSDLDGEMLPSMRVTVIQCSSETAAGVLY